MKIAFPTNNGRTISAHFGHATHYLVVTIENGEETAREMREKAHHGASHNHNHYGNGHGHGHNHGGMVAPLSDCDVFVTGGIGIPAAQAVKQMGVQVVPTGTRNIDEAVTAILQNALPTDPTRVHMPGQHRH